MTSTSARRGSHLVGIFVFVAGCSQQAGIQPELSFWSSSQRVESVRETDPFVTRLTGAPPGARVTLHSRFRGYHGWATYMADDAGEVDVGRDAAVDGTYAGVDPNGPVWSMRNELQHESNEPESTETDGALDIQFRAEVDGALLSEATLARNPVEHGLYRRTVEHENLVGTLFSPTEGTPRATVLVLGGSEGGLAYASHRAAYLASRGYTALALAYFGIDPLPKTLSAIPLEYFAAALSWLAKQPEADAQRMAVLGVSRGGELALLLGATFPELRAVVAEVPSPVRWSGLSFPVGAAWTYHGDPLPFLTWTSDAAPSKEQLPNGATGYRFTPAFEYAFNHATPDSRNAATIAVELTRGPILLTGAGDDGVWPSCAFSDAVFARLQAAGHTLHYPDEAVCFAGAGHLMDPPGRPTTDLYSHPLEGFGALIFGGTAGALARSQRDNQARIESFLGAALRE